VTEGSITAALWAVKEAGKVRVVVEVGLFRAVLRVGLLALGWLRLRLREVVEEARGDERVVLVEEDDLVSSVVSVGRYVVAVVAVEMFGGRSVGWVEGGGCASNVVLMLAVSVRVEDDWWDRDDVFWRRRKRRTGRQRFSALVSAQPSPPPHPLKRPEARWGQHEVKLVHLVLVYG